MGSRRRNLFVLLLVVGLTAASAIAIATKPTVLGLDLSGGSELIYQARPTAQNPEVDQEDLDRSIELIRERIDTFGVTEPEISRFGSDQIVVQLPDVQDADEAAAQIGETAQLFFYDFEPNVIPPEPGAEDAGARSFNRLYDAVKAASEREPECFEDLCTANGPTFYAFDSNTLQLLEQPASSRSELAEQFPEERIPPDAEVLAVPQGTVVVQAEQAGAETEASEAARGYYVLRDRPELSGDEIEDPQQNFDPTTNQPIVTFEFTDEGRQSFHDVTRRIAQRGVANAPPAICQTNPAQADQFSDSFAIVLDDEIVSRPIINFCENPDGIDGRTGAQISGTFTIDEAQTLANFLRIGALPVELALISQSTVSASLGEQALDQGLKAGIGGLIIVLLFLFAYYRFLGVVAGLGLLVYALFFLALIKAIPITMTLPGIAGLVLTIGVAADSNIVIFERIKEEVRAGRSTLSAITQGYRKGIATIIDANVITLITAFILFVLATSGVKGFAFTLGVGTIVSLFTAVLFTQAVLGVLGRSRILRSPSFLGAGEQRVHWDFDFTGMSRWFFSMSGLILVVGAVAFAVQQFNFGIDFESGTRVKTSLSEPASVDEVRSAISDSGVPGAGGAEIQEVADQDFGENVVQISIEAEPDDVEDIRDALDDEFGVAEDGFDSNSVGPTFGATVARSAILAILFSLLVISAYVGIRFEAKYAIPVLIALIHDLLITGGIYALTGRELTSATVAAFLTIQGYSLYDCVIVFDRIRENVPRMPRAAFSQVVNRSMSEILTRSLITGLSTAFVIVMLFVFGGETLRDFAFAMAVGIVSGTYSSIFIAAPVLTAWKEREPTYRNRRARLLEVMGRVPTFPEDNEVARLAEAERETGEPGEPVGVGAPTAPAAGSTAPEAEAAPAEQPPRAPAPSRADRPGEGDSEPPGGSAEGTSRSGGSKKRSGRQRRRRKHGRPR